MERSSVKIAERGFFIGRFYCLLFQKLRYQSMVEFHICISIGTRRCGERLYPLKQMELSNILTYYYLEKLVKLDNKEEMTKFVRRYIPKSVRKTIRNVLFFPIDIIDAVLGRRDELTPPKSMIFIEDGDFKSIGKAFLKNFVEIGYLKKTDSVLDVGCGIGRMAVPLTNYLSNDSRYEGFDIVPEGIEWCNKEITSRYPNFHFQVADIYNEEYNPKGIHKSSNYSFPYDDASFDFLFLTSVFTHMLATDVENYMSEISRVTKKGKRVLITFFLLNSESLNLSNAKLSKLDFKYQLDGCKTIDQDIPEKAIAYDEETIRHLLKKNDLELDGSIHYGSWCGRENYLGYQDIVVAVKR